MIDSNAGSRGPLNVSAEKPKFLVDADFQASAGGDVGDEADLSDSSESSSDDDDDDDVPANVPKTGVAEVEDQVEAGIDAAANALSVGGNLNQSVKDCPRPMPTRAQVGRFLQREVRKPTILHDLGHFSSSFPLLPSCPTFIKKNMNYITFPSIKKFSACR
jgi:hypothetical protein